MKINFVTIGDQTIASYRYHNVIPGLVLNSLGHEVLLSLSPCFDQDVYIFSKHYNYGDYWYARGLKAEGKQVVFHCCDNHLSNSGHEEHYRRMLGLADKVIVPTHAMAEVVSDKASRLAAVIPDTYEMPKIPALCNPDDNIKVLWFGHQSNLRALTKELPLPDKFELRLCTNLEKPDKTQIKLPMTLDKVPYVKWSLNTLMNSLSLSDCVILPMLDTEKDNAKSHNRLSESVMRGKFVIANMIPEYKQFESWMYIGNIHDGLAWLKKQSQGEIERRITACQAYIEQTYNPVIIGKRWNEVLSC